MTKCAVTGCKETGYHTFPSDKKRRRLWAKAIQRPELAKSASCLRICRHHFNDKDFKTVNASTGFNLVRRFLKEDAVPSLFPWSREVPPFAAAPEEILQDSNIKKELFPATSEANGQKKRLDCTIMDEDFDENYNEGEEICNLEQFMLQNEIKTEIPDAVETVVQENQCVDRNYTKKDNAVKKLQQILYSTQYCSFCMKTEGALMSIYRCLKIHCLHDDREDEKVSIKEILSDIFHDISDLLVTSYICQSCVNEAVQAYTFIHKSKRSVNKINTYVKEFHSKLSSLEEQIDPNEDHSNLKYLIVLEPSMFEVSDNTSKVITEKPKEDSRNLKQNTEELAKEVRGPVLVLDGTQNKLEINNVAPLQKVSLLDKETNKAALKEDKIPNDSVKCKICFETSSNSRSLMIHYRNHDRTKCRICHMIMLNSDLQLHIQLHHRDSVYSCDYCNEVHYTETALAKHVEMHNNDDTDQEHSDQCVMCLKHFNEEMLLNHLCRYKCSECNITPCVHQKYLIAYRENRFNSLVNKCPDCDYVCRGKYDLIEHANREHLDYHQHKCNLCGTEYYSKTMLEAHKRRSHSQDLVCEYCDRVFQDLNEFSRHDINMCELDFRKFPCDECKASFDTSDMLSIHKYCRHKEIPSFKPVDNDKTVLKSNPSISRIGNKVQKVFQCQICKIVYGCKPDYMKHVMKEHGPNYSCDLCNENFNELNAILLHYNEQHSDSLVCDMCGKSFETQRKLILHRRTGHTEPVQCHICTKMIRAISMKSHMKWHKVQEDPSLKKSVQPRLFECDYCGRILTNKQALMSHINRHHLKVKPFNCKICGVSYSCKYQLNEHMLKHSEENWQKCNICDKKFRHRKGLKKHMMLHTGERPHVCDICGLGCITVTRLKEHVKRHSEKKLNCPLCNRKFYFVKNLRYHIKHSHWDNKDVPFDHTLVEGLTKEHDYIFQDGRTVNRL